MRWNKANQRARKARSETVALIDCLFGMGIPPTVTRWTEFENCIRLPTNCAAKWTRRSSARFPSTHGRAPTFRRRLIFDFVHSRLWEDDRNTSPTHHCSGAVRSRGLCIRDVLPEQIRRTDAKSGTDLLKPDLPIIQLRCKKHLRRVRRSALVLAEKKGKSIAQLKVRHFVLFEVVHLLANTEVQPRREFQQVCLDRRNVSNIEVE